MPDYEFMYLVLFNAITDALDDLDELNIGLAKYVLKNAQIRSENIYIEQGEEEPGQEKAAEEKGE